MNVEFSATWNGIVCDLHMVLTYKSKSRIGAYYRHQQQNGMPGLVGPGDTGDEGSEGMEGNEGNMESL